MTNIDIEKCILRIFVYFLRDVNHIARPGFETRVFFEQGAQFRVGCLNQKDVKFNF